MSKAKTKRAKGKGASPEQGQLPNTGRLDAVPSIEAAARAKQERQAELKEAKAALEEADEALTEALIESKRPEYIYQGKDGKPYCAYIPKTKKAKAKIRAVKAKKPDLGDGDHS
jgi:hypothetical protein